MTEETLEERVESLEREVFEQEDLASSGASPNTSIMYSNGNPLDENQPPENP